MFVITIMNEINIINLFQNDIHQKLEWKQKHGKKERDRAIER